MSLHLFNCVEKIPSNYISTIPNDFKVNHSIKYDMLLLRILTATTEIIYTKNSTKIILSKNYLDFPSHQISRKSSKPIKAYLYPYKLKDYVKYSNKFYGRNIRFYHNILQELCYYFYYTKIGNHQSAFVNLYRVLEFISYSFPLIHASHFGNFSGSFEAFKSYFMDNKSSEITFFEKFVEKLFNSTSYLSLTTTFNFNHLDNIIADNCFKSVKDLIKSTDWVNSDNINHTLEIENSKLIRLFKSIRNRYFHFAVGGHRNLFITDLKDPDFLFERINDNFLNWFTFIYATTIKENLDNSII